MRLTRHRQHSGSMAKAAFLSARNDVFANIAIISAGSVTIIWPFIYPDLVVGIGIAIMNADTAREIWQAAATETPDRAAEP